MGSPVYYAGMAGSLRALMTACSTPAARTSA
ncbi:MAG: hypothetical protein ACLTDR_07150 [Adlercreutzia equolifaciens]